MEHHTRVKELFLKARELSLDSRDEFLQRECGDDITLRLDVTSLLAHDAPTTILARPAGVHVDAPTPFGRGRSGLLSRIKQAAAQLLQSVFGRPGPRLAVMVAGLLFLAGLAMWMYAGMRQSTQQIAASELETILTAHIKALELWIEEKRKTFDSGLRGRR